MKFFGKKIKDRTFPINWGNQGILVERPCGRSGDRKRISIQS